MLNFSYLHRPKELVFQGSALDFRPQLKLGKQRENYRTFGAGHGNERLNMMTAASTSFSVTLITRTKKLSERFEQLFVLETLRMVLGECTPSARPQADTRDGALRVLDAEP
jgi:hypothetical protein